MIEVKRIRSKRKSIFGSLTLTTKLIVLNVFFYFASIILLGFFGEAFFLEKLALTPFNIFKGKSLWTLLTSMFMHGSFFHLFANMFSLFFIGNFLEKIVGRKRFLWLYLAAGLIGSIFFVLAGGIFNDNSAGVGASGAIFGVLGVLAVLIPYSKIYLIVGPIILILLEFVLGPFIPLGLSSLFSLIINLLFIGMFFALFSFNPNFRKFAVPLELPMWVLPIVAIVPLVIIDFFIDLPIGNSAHIGGLLAGIVYGFYLKKNYKNKTSYIRKYFS